MTMPRLPDSTSTAWLVLGAATGFITDVPLPHALLQLLLRTTSIGAAAIDAATHALIADGLRAAADAAFEAQRRTPR